VLRGVELYRGKPILYSLGNFLFQNETVFKLPGDIYERYDLGQERTPADVYDQRTDDGESGFPAHREFWESVVAEIVFKERELVELKLHPIGLGHGRPRSQRGRPVLVVGSELGEKILDDVERLSEPFGTVVEREAGVGVIRPRSQATT
jgi:poly-gamma-glutamate synthesis protein (capsule biosynthesis protein)